MKQITFGFALTSGCLKTSTAWTHTLPKIGSNNLCLFNVIDKSYNHKSFALDAQNIIKGPNGIVDIIITYDSSIYSEMTVAKKMSLPVKYQKACEWINRFPPDNEINYINYLYDSISELDKLKLLPYISFQTSQEIDSAKYFHGTYPEGVFWTNIKVDVLKTTNRPIYIGDFTSKKILGDYRNFVDSNLIFDLPNVHYSTSLYCEDKGALISSWKVNYPTRNLPGSAIVAYSIGTSTNKARINSDMWMVRAVQMLQWAYDKQIDYIYYWKLLECKGEDGMYASQTKLPNGGWETNDVWWMQLTLISICKGGYEPTQDGIIGANGKRIVITGSGYSVV